MLCAFVTALLLVATQTPLRADSIWDKAVDLAKAAEHLVPGNMKTLTQEYSFNGTLKSTRETIMRARVIDEALTYEVVSDMRDGHEAESTQTDATTGASSMQFTSEIQVALSAMTDAQRDGELRTIEGQSAIGYRVEIPMETYTIRGQGWVSEEGVPLELHYTADPLPRAVKSLAIRTTYGAVDGLPVVTETTVQVAIGISIFYRRLYTITVVFEDYFDPDD